MTVTNTIRITRKLNGADIVKIYNYYNNLLKTKGISGGNIDIDFVDSNIIRLKFYVDLPF